MAQRFLPLHALGWVALALGGCGDPPAPRAESAILITVDTLSAKALSCYGGPPGWTPHLDQLAEEALVFRAARTVAPLTLPAHASMLTGLYPPRHRLRDNGLGALPASATTLAEGCRAAGFETAAFVSAAVLDRAFALDQGFDVYDGPPRPTQQNTSHYSERTAQETLARARSWLAGRDRARPFLLWIHLYDPHVPYAAPADFAARAQALNDFGGLRTTDVSFMRPYLGEVAYVDDALGSFLADLRADRTLERAALLLTSDHGESLGLHGEPTHGAFCYDATLRVPLLLRLPDGSHSGETRDEPVSVVDVLPTLLELLGLPARDDIDGVSLLAEAPPARGVYCESYSGYLNYGWSPLAGWCADEAKYLHSSRPEYYLLATDPREQIESIRSHAADARAFKEAIAGLYQRTPLEPDGGATRLSSELLRDLRSLGYGALGDEFDEVPHPLEPSTRPSPSTQADELQPLLVANALAAAGDYEPAIRLLEGIVAENPGHLLALDYLGFALMQLGKFGRALDVLEGRVQLGARRADTYINIATCREFLGEPAAARVEFERALELDPANFQALEALARLCRATNDEASALRYEARLAAERPRTVDTRAPPE